MENTTGKVIHKNSFSVTDSDYKGKSGITEIVLPKTVSEIDKFAFYNCRDLKKIKLSEKLKSIPQYAFANCTSLESIEIPEGVTLIGKNAFENCKNLKSVTLPKSLRLFDASVFRDCKHLEEIIIPEGVSYLPDSLFENCSSLKRVVLPDLRIIGSSSFKGCSALRDINLPDTITSISSNAFEGCKKLSSVILPSSLSYLGEAAFSGCSSLENIIIPKDVNEIEKYTFSNCASLNAVHFLGEISAIKEFAFSNCQKLIHVPLPSSVKIISENAFENCFSLYDIELPENLLNLGESAFFHCESITSMKIPKNIEKLPNSVFEGCKNLRAVELNDKIRSVGTYAFRNCQSLENISFPKSTISLGYETFSGCTSLKSIVVPDVTALGKNLFCGCTSLEKVVLPEGLSKISEHTFLDCKSLREIKLPSTLMIISDGAFLGSGIEEITIPPNIRLLGNYAFEDCIHLEKVSLPDNIHSISNSMFKGCSSLRSITIPSAVEKIGDSAFEGCNDLILVKLPSTVREIGKNAFSGCNDLKNFRFSNHTQIYDLINPKADYYFTRQKGGYSLSQSKSSDSIPAKDIKISLPFLAMHWDKREKLFSEQKNPTALKFYNEYLSTANCSKAAIDKFIDNHNFVFLKQMPLSADKNYKNLFSLLYNLGAMNKPVTLGGKTVDYAQKVTEFLLEKIRKGETTEEKLNDPTFQLLDGSGIKPEFTEFFLQNFDEMFETQKEIPGFIARCYNEFEKVQKTNTSNRGTQRQLKATVKKFRDYFNENKFIGIDSETRQIAEILSPYFDEQSIFNDAVAINSERIRNNTPNNILGEKLKESKIFSRIDEMSEKIQSKRISILRFLTELANKQFTYEWLEKNDPQNFILGKLCSSCAHISGMGYGIMHASIVHPNVQNLVVRNSRNDIIAKSTLYVNPDEQYGVFNTVQVHEDYYNDREKLEKIYSKIMKGIRIFAKRYNTMHPDKPLKQINMGMNLNSVEQMIHQHHKKSRVILPTLNYGSDYGTLLYDHNGDDKKEQYIVWVNPEFKKEVNKNAEEEIIEKE